MEKSLSEGGCLDRIVSSIRPEVVQYQAEEEAWGSNGLDATSMLQKHDVVSRLRTKYLGNSILTVEKCTSTNDLAVEAALAGMSHGLVVIANEQTRGRGRYGRTWVSPRGGIWMTILLRPPIDSATLRGLTVLSSLAIARSVSNSLGVKAMVRWPNDVVVANRKLAGVLAESRVDGNELVCALVGMGVNANFHAPQIEGSNQQPTTLLDEVGSPIDRAALVSRILSATEQLLDGMHTLGEQHLLEVLRCSEVSIGRHAALDLGGQLRVEGIIQDYESLTSIRIMSESGKLSTIEAGSVISVSYLD